jgi:hypothetical protein
VEGDRTTTSAQQRAVMSNAETAPQERHRERAHDLLGVKPTTMLCVNHVAVNDLDRYGGYGARVVTPGVCDRIAANEAAHAATEEALRQDVDKQMEMNTFCLARAKDAEEEREALRAALGKIAEHTEKHPTCDECGSMLIPMCVNGCGPREASATTSMTDTELPLCTRTDHGEGWSAHLAGQCDLTRREAIAAVWGGWVDRDGDTFIVRPWPRPASAPKPRHRTGVCVECKGAALPWCPACERTHSCPVCGKGGTEGASAAAVPEPVCQECNLPNHPTHTGPFARHVFAGGAAAVPEEPHYPPTKGDVWVDGADGEDFWTYTGERDESDGTFAFTDGDSTSWFHKGHLTAMRFVRPASSPASEDQPRGDSSGTTREPVK